MSTVALVNQLARPDRTEHAPLASGALRNCYRRQQTHDLGTLAARIDKEYVAGHNKSTKAIHNA